MPRVDFKFHLFLDEDPRPRNRHRHGHGGGGLIPTAQPAVLLGLLVQHERPSRVPEPLMVARQPSISVREEEVHLWTQHFVFRRMRKPEEDVCGCEIPPKPPPRGLGRLGPHRDRPGGFSAKGFAL